MGHDSGRRNVIITKDSGTTIDSALRVRRTLRCRTVSPDHLQARAGAAELAMVAIVVCNSEYGCGPIQDKLHYTYRAGRGFNDNMRTLIDLETERTSSY